MQQFLTRSDMHAERVMEAYQAGLARRINSEHGMLSVDESDFEKKGKEAVGVQRQYCGRLGKTENCQAGVFLAYAGEEGYGLVDRIDTFLNAGFSPSTQSGATDADHSIRLGILQP